MQNYQIISSAYRIEDIEVLAKAGADALIFSLKNYSTHAMHYINLRQIKKAIKLTHQYNMKFYLNYNIIIVEKDIAQVYRHFEYFKGLEIDGIYFGDLACLQIGQELGMENLLIYSPDTIITNAMDINLYVEEGCQFVALSKEITLDEILEIGLLTNYHAEIIIHGRLNMFNSKRRLLTSYFKFLKKDYPFKDNYNLYLIEEKRTDKMPIVEDKLGTHIFTGFTLNSFLEVKEILAHKINKFRIDGIFRSLADQLELIKDYKDILESRVDPQLILDKHLAKDNSITSGFYYNKTIAKR